MYGKPAMTCFKYQGYYNTFIKILLIFSSVSSAFGLKVNKKANISQKSEFESVETTQKDSPKRCYRHKLLHKVIKVKKSIFAYVLCVLELNFETINDMGEPSC